MRAAIVGGLEDLGISIDPAKNAVRSPDPRVVSPDGAKIKVQVIPTNEELAIAEFTLGLVK
jgi:acetate kinase